MDQGKKGAGDPMILGGQWAARQWVLSAEQEREQEDRSDETMNPAASGSGPPCRWDGGGGWHGGLLDTEARQLITVRPG